MNWMGWGEWQQDNLIHPSSHPSNKRSFSNTQIFCKISSYHSIAKSRSQEPSFLSRMLGNGCVLFLLLCSASRETDQCWLPVASPSKDVTSQVSRHLRVFLLSGPLLSSLTYLPEIEVTGLQWSLEGSPWWWTFKPSILLTGVFDILKWGEQITP